MAALPRKLRAYVITLSVLALAIAGIVGIVVARSIHARANKGEDTTCPDFLAMSTSEQAAVIDEMGWVTSSGRRAQLRADAVSECRRVRNTNDEDDSLEIVLGP